MTVGVEKMTVGSMEKSQPESEVLSSLRNRKKEKVPLPFANKWVRTSEEKCIHIINSYKRRCKEFINIGELDNALNVLNFAMPYTHDEQNPVLLQGRFPEKDEAGFSMETKYKLCRIRAELHLAKAKIYFKEGELFEARTELNSIGHIFSALSETEEDMVDIQLQSLLLKAYIYLLLGVDRYVLEIVEEMDKYMEEENVCKEDVDFRLLQAGYLVFLPRLYAHEWHRNRRRFIQEEHPVILYLYEKPNIEKVRFLVKDENLKEKLFWHGITPVTSFHGYVSGIWNKYLGVSFGLSMLLLLMVIIQGWLALFVGSLKSLSMLFLLSGTVGATISYGFQAINHDLSHTYRHPLLVSACMLISSSMCNFPWALYYKNYHAKHHQYTGGDKDRDGDILFQPWHSPPLLRIKLVYPSIMESRISLLRWYQSFKDESKECVPAEYISPEPSNIDNAVTAFELVGNPVGDTSLGLRRNISMSELNSEDNTATPDQKDSQTTEPVSPHSSLNEEKCTEKPNRSKLTCSTEKEVESVRSRYVEFDVDFANHWSKRFLWTVIFSWGIYLVFHIRKYQFDTFHKPTVKFEGLWLLTTVILGYYGGTFALLYIWWSCAFSLGAFCHPYFGFWLLQHSCKARPLSNALTHKLEKLAETEEWPKDLLVANVASQPTISYSGSFFWNALNFGELWHVEHHDFPMIPAVRYPELRQIVPEYFENLFSCASIMGFIRDWVLADDIGWMYENGDFAAREEYYADERYEPAINQQLVDSIFS